MSPADSPFAQLPTPGPHPAPAELRAYAAGTLTAAEQHRIEAHTLDCARCADLVDGFSMSDAATTDQAVATLRARLHARTGAALPGMTAPEPVPTGWAWPRLAAAAALLAVVGGGIWGWEQRVAAPTAATARLETAAPAPTLAQAPAASEPALKPASAATGAAAPKAAATAKEAEYAAAPAAPPRVAARRGLRQITKPATVRAGRNDAADGEILASTGAAAESVMANEAADTLQSPARMAAAPPAKSLSATSDGWGAASDTAAAKAGDYATASPAKKATALSPATADKAVAARVRATPMPVAPAIVPVPVGGTPALRSYVRREAALFQPDEKAPRLTGSVRITFVVDADGKLRDLKVARGLRADYDAEALRIVGEGPAWQPGVAGGRRASLPVEVTVPF
ncbi:energy transducer TonB [Hymenobacter sp.]|uniref:energy transducer TonB n=1 Tax=Hymenobacter sp. TaxID=1898978 RepID=UPI00286A5E1D|nr:energy transducer TonB [Hymenobacter sp.]